MLVDIVDTTSNPLRLWLTPFDFGHSGTEVYFLYPIEPEGVYITSIGKLVEIDESQAWFWTEEWQAGERAVQADIEAGRTYRFSNVEDAISALGLEEDVGD